MLLKTRFYLPPLRDQAIIRSALLDVLKQSAGGELILVSAPAGYGKTTLISQWLHLQPHTFAWLSLDFEHNLPTLFWEYVITALNLVQPEIGAESLESLSHQANTNLQPVIVTLLNELDRLSVDNRSKQPITLVWDDFHHIKNHQIVQQCNLLLDHLPSTLRIVITARETPPLALARRRANGQLVQLGIEELRFNQEESRQFFQHTMALSVAPDLTATLCGKTEGWIAGLQLAALSLKRNPADTETLLTEEGVNRHIADYLLEEVFAGLAPETQLFLLYSAIPRRFCAGLLNAMLNRTGTQDTLVTLDNSHLFLVALDNHRTWFRFHDLFRQFLVQRLRLIEKINVSAHALSAIQWFENNGYYEDAIELSLEWSAFNETARLLKQYQLLNATVEADARVAQWIGRLPQSYSNLKEAHSTAQTQQALLMEERVEPLTFQEKRVLELISQGLSNKAIADKLHISANTLKVHIRNLYGKMGVETRTQALLKFKSP